MLRCLVGSMQCSAVQGLFSTMRNTYLFMSYYVIALAIW